MNVTIKFMRGDVRKVNVSKLNNALGVCKKMYPETNSWDVLDIVPDNGEEHPKDCGCYYCRVVI